MVSLSLVVIMVVVVVVLLSSSRGVLVVKAHLTAAMAHATENIHIAT